MATRTITHLYDSFDNASGVVRELEAAGVPHDDISLVGSNHAKRSPTTASATTEPGSGAGTGATIGTVVGGGAGLLAGIGALAIPGVGPIVAAGWLIATLTGAGIGAAAGGAAGGLVGSLTGAGINEADAHVYAEGVRRGGTLVTVRATDEAQAGRIEGIVTTGNHVNPSVRRADYQAEGWTQHDPSAHGYTTAEVEAERQRGRPYPGPRDAD